MKKIFNYMLIMLSVMMITPINKAWGQTSYGTWATIQIKRMMPQYEPQLMFVKHNNEFMLALRLVYSDEYAKFDEDSRILVKFDDGSIVKLPIIIQHDVQQKYDNMYSSLYGKVLSFYITSTFYEISQEFIEPILKDDKKIIKVRIVRANSVITDYDIAEKHQEQFRNELKESYFKVEVNDIQRQKNSRDEGF